MFGSLGFQEVALILVLALLIFGPRKLPEIGRTLGKAMGEFRRATSDLKRSIENEVDLEDRRRPSLPAATIKAPETAAEPASAVEDSGSGHSATTEAVAASPPEESTAAHAATSSSQPSN